MVAVIFLAACGTTNGAMSPGGDDDDMGSDVGSGSGSDATHPQNKLLGKIYDERNDTIDFTSGAPVHTHGGVPVDLSFGCPAVYKYGYLESPHTYGQETAPNPLAWHLYSDSDQVSYQVTSDAGGTVVNWTQIRRSSDGDYVIDLSGAQLASRGGKMSLEVKVGDQTLTQCFVNHPMAAPLKIDAPSNVLTAHVFPELFLSKALNPGEGLPVATFTITQYAAEPITTSFQIQSVTGTAQGQMVNRYMLYGQPFVDGSACVGTYCAGVPAAIYSDVAPTALEADWAFVGTQVCESSGLSATCKIPARSDGAPPQVYTLTLAMSTEKTVSPGLTVLTNTTYGDTLLLNKPVSGLIQSDFTRACYVASAQKCLQSADFKHVVAVNRLKLDMDAIDVTLASRSADDTESIGIGNRELPAFSWDVGNANL